MPITQVLLTSNVEVVEPPPPPTISASGWTSPLNEGSTSTVTVSWENQLTNSTVYWSIDNFESASASDWAGGVTPSGTVSITGASGSTTFSYSTAADLTTEGTEGYVLTIGTSPGGTDIVNQYLQIADSSTEPPNDFTVEWFQKSDLSNTNKDPYTFSKGGYAFIRLGFAFDTDQDDIYVAVNQNSGSWKMSIPNQINALQFNGIWRHIALSRSSGTLRLFVDGQQIQSVSSSERITDLTSPLFIGAEQNFRPNSNFTGYLHGFKWTKGTAWYTSNFTPIQYPTSTGSAQLVLNTMSDNTKLTDSSAAGKVPAVVNGTITWSSQSPFVYEGSTFTALGYGDNKITPTVMPQRLQVGYKVTDGEGWTDYILGIVDGGQNLLFANPVVAIAPSSTYTISQELGPITITFNTGGRNNQNIVNLDVALPSQGDKSAVLAVRAGWAWSCTDGTSGFVTGIQNLPSGEDTITRILVFKPDGDITGTYTFTAPDYGGSIYFNGNSDIVYDGSDPDFAMDA